MTIKKNGRPSSYTEGQVLEGIGIVEQDGEIPSGESVKKAMCDQLMVSGGINAQSLDKEVRRLIDERDRMRIDRLVVALPATSKAAADDLGKRLTAAIVEHLADDHNQLQIAAGKKLVEAKADLSCHRAQNRDLQAKLESKDEALAEREAEAHELEQRLASALAEISILKDRISALRRDDDFRAQMLEVMRDAIGDRQLLAE